MRKIASLFLTISLVLCVLLALPISANAASVETKDGLEVSIITDKEDYAADEDIAVSVKIKNNNANSVENVSLETLLPDGLTLKTGDLTMNNINIETGETYSANVVARLSNKANDNGETKPDNSTKPDDTTKPGDNQNTTKPEDTAKPGNNQDVSTPQTGGSSQIALWIVLFVVSVVAIVLLVVFRHKSKKSIKMLSLILCVAMTFSMIPMGVFATESSDTIISVDKTITVNGTEYVIKANVLLAKSDDDFELIDFKASHFDIYINSVETVTFTVCVNTLSKSSYTVNLIEENEVIAVMNDDGINGDLVASDGIYSVALDLSKNEVSLINYYAKCQTKSSNTFEICYYRDLTQDEFVAFSKLMSLINQMTFDEAKQFIKDSEEISHFEINEITKTISYKSIYGISGIWENQSSETKGSGPLAISTPQGLDYNSVYNEALAATESDRDITLPNFPSVSDYNLVKETVSNASIESNLTNTNVIVLRPFRTSQFRYDDFLYAGEVLSEGLGGSLTVIDDENVSLSAMKSLGDYGIVLIDSHGGLSDMYKKTYIVTGESFDETRFLLDPIYYTMHLGYSADYLADRIFGTGANRAGVSSKFFDKYYSDNSLSGSFWFLGSCYSYYNDTLPNSILGKGAQAVIGFSNPVSVWYCNHVLFECVINSMLLSADTLSTAVGNVKNIYGDRDAIEQAKDNTITEIKYNNQSPYKIIESIAVPNGSLSGKICKASDRTTVIPKATIEVYKNNALYKISTSDSSGNYTIDLPEGKYLVKISAPGYIDFKSYATVTKNENTYMETFLLIEGSEDETGVAGGKVVNSLTGNGTTGVTLSFKRDWNNTNEDDDIIKTAVTDSNGNYTVELPLGNYTAIATKEGYTSSSFNIIVQVGTTGNQNGTITPIISGDNYLITLTWGENPRDLDSHVEGKLSNGESFNVYYLHNSQYDGDIEVCNLDYDDTDSYGPEHITLNTTSDTPYYYYIYRYAGSGTVAMSGAKVTIEQGNTLIAEFNVPTDLGSGDYWNVFTIKNGELIIRNTITDYAETDYAG